MNTKSIGSIGEAAALQTFLQLNCAVAIPFGENNSYDLLVEINKTFHKIQVKTTSKCVDGVMKFSLTHNKGKYNNEEIDYFFLYCIENGYKGLLKSTDTNKTSITIRERKTDKRTKNNKLSNEFSFDINKIK